jgi:hypoxanthine phosphoribosyltransferase
VMMSHYTGVKMHTLDVRLRDADHSPEHAVWMAEEAGAGKRILILDDINDTGETFKWIVKDWEESNPPADWVDVWGNTVRFATIIDNVPSKFDVDYTSIEINKAEDPAWIVFPFEEWW